MAEYLSFHRMLSTSIIKALYGIGAGIISLVGFVGLVYGFTLFAIELDADEVNTYLADQHLIMAGVSLGVLLLGNLFWRLICEAWILIFSIHEVLVSIERNTLTGSREQA